MSGENAEYTTIPDYQLIKGTYATLYFVALENMGNYIMDKTTHNQAQARESILNLSMALFPKIYVLKDENAINFLAYYMRNPHKFMFMDIFACWLILQRIVERLGITKIESLQLAKHKSYTENANY